MEFINLGIKNLLSFNKIFFFILIYLSLAYFSFWNYYFYYTEDTLYATYGEQISYVRLLSQMGNGNKFLWITISLIPIIILIRVLFTTLALKTGGFFSDNKGSTISYFNISLKAEIVIILMYFTKWIFIEFVWDITTLNDLSQTPFTLFRYFANSDLPSWSIVSLSYISIWEFLYMFFIALFLGYYNQQSFKHNFAFTLSTYGVALLFWIVVLTYIAITLT